MFCMAETYTFTITKIPIAAQSTGLMKMISERFLGFVVFSARFLSSRFFAPSHGVKTMHASCRVLRKCFLQAAVRACTNYNSRANMDLA